MTRVSAKLCAIACCLVALSATLSARAGELAVFSYALPPVTFAQGATIAGPAAAIVAELARAVGLPERPTPAPVARLLAEVERGEGIGFPLARNPAREPRFEWIVEIYQDAFAFATLTPHPVVNSLEQARRLGSITVNNGSAPLNHLTAVGGFDNLDIANSEVNNALKLYAGNADAWYSVQSGFRPMARINGLDPDRLVIGAPITTIGVWLIGPKSLPPDTLARMRRRFEEMRASGEYDRIMAGVF